MVLKSLEKKNPDTHCVWYKDKDNKCFIYWYCLLL